MEDREVCILDEMDATKIPPWLRKRLWWCATIHQGEKWLYDRSNIRDLEDLLFKRMNVS